MQFSHILAMLAVVAVVAIAAPLGVLKNSDVAFAGLNKLAPVEVQNNVWAVLVAGSSGWSNYRHQSDVCHAYQTLHKAGVPDERIIVMMYDDIATSSSNPTKGVIINEPNGADVYHGVPKDYTKDQVTRDNFIKVLTGIPPAVGSKKILKSGPNDHVYIFFDDHGNTDIIAFPNDDLLTSKQLSTTLNTMSKKQMFGSMVVYISACLSGSMFYKITLPANVYAATSAPVAASGFAINYDTKRRTYLASGWPYGINKFMDVSSSNRDTFDDQFTFATANLENYSQPCQYGDVDLAKQTTLTDFFTGASSNPTPFLGQPRPVFNDAVPEWEVPYELARRAHMADNSDASYVAFKQEETIKSALDKLASKIAIAAVGDDSKLLPCTTCDSTCNCVKECDSSDPEECKFECCNEKACTQDYKKTGLAAKAEQTQMCVSLLTKAMQSHCGLHPYLAKAEAAVHRICRQRGVNMRAAMSEVRRQCSAVATLF